MDNCSIYITIVFILLISCKDDEKQESHHPLFSLMDSEHTSIDFINQVEDSKTFNIYTYRNFYNGGGVAIGDLNNDNLPDIYLTGNMVPNKLYLNKGSLQFDDISEKAGVEGTRSWSTGVTMADVNADGFLDIYVCNSGDAEGDDRQNELFINNGDLTFTESAQKYGLADIGYSTQAAFFDYDHDSDLDVYVLNNSFRAIGSFSLQQNQRYTRDQLGGHKLYRNDDGHYTDVSESAGIFGSTIAFGLGIVVSDLNKDSWPDLYICNDFFERDYLYINNRNGTFSERLPQCMSSISMASMGVDAADINGDAFPEIFVTEMLPKEEARIKTSMTFENWNKYQHNVSHDYHHQFTRNMLHVNNGLSDKDEISFSEIGRLSGVEATDWSWSTLITDLDNNGHKDIYITNGIFKDILNQDYLRYISNEEVIKSIRTEKGVDYKKLIDIIPSNPVANFAFSGSDGLFFSDSTQQWGLAQKGFSSGAAYGDLDNDGDFDLVINNVNDQAFVYRNNTNTRFPQNHYLKIHLQGSSKNIGALGARITARCSGKLYYLENYPVRGFQSSVDHNLIIGLGSNSEVDSLIVEWPSGKRSVLLHVPADQQVTLNEGDAVIPGSLAANKTEVVRTGFYFRDHTSELPDHFRHEENTYNDFDKDALVFQMSSTEGPRLAVGDVNCDGLEDVYIGGAKDAIGKLLIQHRGGKFVPQPNNVFEEDRRCEDVDAHFFDADNDQDLDLYVVSGGNEYPSSSSALSDRLYLNDGHGKFSKSKQLLPTSKFESTSCVEAADFDHDSDVDLFVGVRLRDRLYGVPQNGYILENDGRGNFKNITQQVAPQLSSLGMIKDACWADYNKDGHQDLIVVGEWMAIHVFQNESGKFKDVSEDLGISDLSGWWNRILPADIDGDGDVDFIAGNHGLNSRFKASPQKPISCYVNDFDENGTVEQVITTFNGDASYPMVLLHDLVGQLPYLKKKYLKYENYKLQTIENIFSDQLSSSIRHSVTTLESVILRNEGTKFSVIRLPVEAQLSPVYAIYAEDLNQDGHTDILLGGNLFEVKPEAGRYDASYGTFLQGKGDGTFLPVSNASCNLFFKGQVRDIVSVQMAGKKLLLAARNNDKVQALAIHKR